MWAKLKEIEPYLYKDNSTGVIYPPAHTTIRDLFGSGDVWLDIAYDPTAAATNILNNKWPSTTKSCTLFVCVKLLSHLATQLFLKLDRPALYWYDQQYELFGHS